MTDETRAPAPGWYSAPHANGEQRYWDGTQWTDWTPDTAAAAHNAAAAAAAPTENLASAGVASLTAAPETPAKKKRLAWWAWALIGLGGLILLGIIIGAVNSASGGAANDERPAAVKDDDIRAEPKPEPKDTRVDTPDVVGKTVAEARAALEGAGMVVTIIDGTGDDWVVKSQTITVPAEPGTEILIVAEAPKPVYTLEQENALRAAKDYLNVMGFSRQGLIDQMSSEYGAGFPVDVATWAVDNVGADWNAEAVEAARSYLDVMAFSRDGLYDQLTSEYGAQFTPEQAAYALGQVGY
ncbi:Ltp family lipoprotein [Microbacterium sp. NPDC058389]|uniref:Ltp family lipoprotein n=1 Tax=Microbacterium sp. NPDC058389 TaxID=3346475 RepID=UPI003661B8D8